ncbi:MAG: GatB/YqeY domain-containing protein [Betaproteobacteria bacterium]|nr:GatB/YqeY domain-containing protein [Betaproteobacteria bacterium]
MTLKDRITEDMKAAMRAKDGQRLSAVRLLLAAIKQREVDERVELADADVLSIIERMVKQRRESIAHYQKAARADLAAQEQFEIGVLSAYLPQQLSEAQIAAAVAAAIAESGAASVRDMGKAMALLKPRLAGKADMGRVSALLKSRLPA